MKTPALTATIVLFAGAVFAGPRSSSSYSIGSEFFGSGGGTTISPSYSHESTIGEVTGTTASTNYIAKSGFGGQGYSVVGLVLDASPTAIDEGQTRQLEAFDLLDDATRIAISETDVSWSVESGPIAGLSNAGLATAGIVYQNTNATVAGTRGSDSATLLLSVMNVTTDDFGTYASDEIDDAWQVQFFGENSANGLATADPDDDGQNNKFEFVAGIVPNDPASRFSLRITNVPGQPGQQQLVFSPRLNDRTYSPQYRNSLTSGDWAELTGTTHSDNDTERTVIDLNATGTAKFYRIDITKP